MVALIALTAWRVKGFCLGSANGMMRPREKRLGVVETAIVDQKRLVLVRRDDVEHLIIVGGPVDMVVETGIKGRPHLEPP